MGTRIVAAAIVTLIALTGCRQQPLGPSLDCTVKVNGSCWTQIGLEEHWVTTLVQTENGLFVGTRSGGVFRYDARTLTSENLGLDHAAISSLVFVPGSSERLLAGIKPEVLGVTATGQEQTPAAVFASDDGGATWTESDGGLASRHDQQYWAYSLASDPNQPQRVYMGSDGPVFRSEDGGRTWEAVLEDEASRGGAWLRSVAISPHLEDRLWVGGHTGWLQAVVYRSEDQGDSWTHVNPTPNRENAVFVVAADPKVPDRVWAGTEEGVLRSDDAGETWSYSLRHQDAALVQCVIFIGNAILAASHRHGKEPVLFQSGDEGETWDRIPVPESLSGLRSMAVDREGTLIVGTTGSGVWRLQK